MVHSVGGDPHFSYRLPKAISAKALVLHFTMASDSSGQGQVFWQEKGVAPAFFRDRSKRFDIQHDGRKREYVVSFTVEHPVLAVRIDPSTARGRITISAMRLSTDGGRVLHRWRF